MQINRRNAIRLAGAALGGSVLGSRAFAQAAPMAATSGVPVSSLSYMAQDIAVAKGFMKAEGLELKTLSAGGGAKLREIVGAGQIEFGNPQRRLHDAGPGGTDVVRPGDGQRALKSVERVLVASFRQELIPELTLNFR